MVGVVGRVVDFLAADVGKDALGVARVLRDQPVHLRDGRGHSFRVSVIEGEAHPYDDGSLKAPADIGLESFRVVVPAGMEEIGSDEGYRAVVETIRAGERTLVDVDDADYHCRLAWPLLATRRCEDRPAVLANPAQPSAPCVALADRVCGDQAESPSLPQQIERPPEEVGDEIGVAV